jgi:hypothetical protein
MSQQNYTITYYGIAIPINEEPLYKHILKQLMSKHHDLYLKCYQDEFDFLNKLPFTNISYQAEDIEVITLTGNYKPIYVDDILILVGDHDTPNIYSAPFKSKQACIKHYKKQFGDILPKDFDYENNIGKISYITWG